MLPDAARLVPPNYDISNRSDPEAMKQLMKHCRELKVWALFISMNVRGV